jgi:cellulose synthase/poly-beta-1,6-N-acetylglucosamine synthase-like glycosyltransferase
MSTGHALAIVLHLSQLLAIAYILYRGGLGVLGLRAPKAPDLGTGKTKFLILVLAHNEQSVIADTVRCMQDLDYTKDRCWLVVVADDCTDATEVEASKAGALVLSKREPSISKGAAMSWALNHSLIKSADWDAVVFFDADSRPVGTFLQMMDGALSRGDLAVQGRRESHGQKGWIPTAYAVNTALRNRLWHQAREAAGFSAALTGTGICLDRRVLSTVPAETHTLTEDLEYGTKLELAGIRARYIHAAATVIDQPPTLRASVGQRLRWARGQVLTSLTYGPALFWRALRGREFSAFDYALYLLLPSLVPLQAFLLLTQGGFILAGSEPFLGGGSWGLDEVVFLLSTFSVTFSFCLTFVGLNVERHEYVLRDWIAFVLLMLTWLPIAMYGAITSWAATWVTTPRSKEPYGTTVADPGLKRPVADSSE